MTAPAIEFPSLVVGMSEEEYHADPCPEPSLSSSIARALVAESPRHAYTRHPRLGGKVRRPSKEMDRGSLVHALLLGKGRELVVVGADDWRTKDARAERDAARDSGKIPVLEADFAEASETAEAIARTLQIDFGIRLTGQSEVSIFWTEVADDGTIVYCRGRLDHLLEVGGRAASLLAYDLKSSRNAHPRACQMHMLEYGYDIQRAAYVSGLEKLYPAAAGRIDFELLFAELEPPHAVTPATAAGTMRELGAMRWRRAVNTWARLRTENYWPAYVTETAQLEAPMWALEKELDNAATI